MTTPSYTSEPEYRALVAAVHAKPADETARLVLADWVQDHGDEDEARAIRARCSVVVDVFPALTKVAEDFARALTVTVAALVEQLRVALDRVAASVTPPKAVKAIGAAPKKIKKPAAKKPKGRGKK